MSFEQILSLSRRNLMYARMHIEDIDDTRMCDQPAGLPNHPAWIVGHIIGGYEMLAGMLGAPAQMSPEQKALFGWGSKATSERSRYPSKADLLKALEASHARVLQAVSAATPGQLSQPNPNERMRSLIPTIGDAVASMLAFHPAIHLGQLSAWRQAMGMDLKV